MFFPNRLVSFLGMASLLLAALLATSTGWSAPIISLPETKSTQPPLKSTEALPACSSYSPAGDRDYSSSLAINLFYAIRCNEPSAVVKYLEDGADPVNPPGGFDYLIDAVNSGFCSVAEELLAHSGPHPRSKLLSATNYEKSTALHIAAAKGHLKCVRAIIKYSKKKNGENNEKYINKARLPSLEPGVSLRLADIFAPESDGRIPIHYPKSDGSAPIHLAAQNGHFRVVKYLLRSGADVNIRRKIDGATPLHLAIHYEHLNVVKALLDCWECNDINYKLRLVGNGYTAYELARKSKNKKIILRMRGLR